MVVGNQDTGVASLVAQAIEKRAAFEKAKIEFEQIKTYLRDLASETGATFVAKEGVVVVSPKAAPTPRINIPAVIGHYGLDVLDQNSLLITPRARMQSVRILSSGNVPIRSDFETEVDQEGE